MKWLKEWWPYLINLVLLSVTIIFAILLWPPKVKDKTETVSTLESVDIQEYGVAGGGVQRVITFRGQGAMYEIVITEVDP
jgi:hypothetical protein